MMSVKPAYYITQQLRLFPVKTSPADCSYCNQVTIHFYGKIEEGSQVPDRLICNQCGTYKH